MFKFTTVLQTEVTTIAESARAILRPKLEVSDSELLQGCQLTGKEKCDNSLIGNSLVMLK